MRLTYYTLLRDYFYYFQNNKSKKHKNNKSNKSNMQGGLVQPRSCLESSKSNKNKSWDPLNITFTTCITFGVRLEEGSGGKLLFFNTLITFHFLLLV